MFLISSKNSRVFHPTRVNSELMMSERNAATQKPLPYGCTWTNASLWRIRERPPRLSSHHPAIQRLNALCFWHFSPLVHQLLPLRTTVMEWNRFGADSNCLSPTSDHNISDLCAVLAFGAQVFAHHSSWCFFLHWWFPHGCMRPCGGDGGKIMTSVFPHGSMRFLKTQIIQIHLSTKRVRFPFLAIFW